MPIRFYQIVSINSQQKAFEDAVDRLERGCWRVVQFSPVNGKASALLERVECPDKQ